MSNQIQITPKRIEANVPSKKIAGLAEKYYFGDDVFDPTEQWAKLSSLLGKIPGKKENITYGVSIDLEDAKGIEYLCGVEVFPATTTVDLSDNLHIKQLPTFAYAVFDHNGHVSQIQQTCDLIWKQWFPQSDYRTPEEADFFFERYGKKFDPDQGKGDIEIWIPVIE